MLPQIKLTDMSRKSVKMDESDITVICFWNRHCRPCIRELTALNILAEDYPNIRFIALTPDSNGEVKRLMGRLQLKWENITVVPITETNLMIHYIFMCIHQMLLLIKTELFKGQLLAGIHGNCCGHWKD